MELKDKDRENIFDLSSLGEIASVSLSISIPLWQ